MLRTTIVLTAALLCACYSGPNQLEYYHPRPVTIHGQIADLPAESVQYAQLNIAMVEVDPYRYPQPPASLVPVTSGTAEPIKEGNVEFAPLGYSYGGADAISPFSSLRFFRPWATLPTAMEGPPDALYPTAWYPGAWSPPGIDLVWAATPTSFSPFGPDYPSVTVPEGYSWLRRQCGPAPGQMQTDVRPIDEAVVFRRTDWMLTPGMPLYSEPIEPLERSFVGSCGVVAPTPDLGSRVSFDHTSTDPIVWSGDSANLYYLSQPDPSDTTKTVGVRELRLADGRSSEIVTVPFGQRLQRDSTGQLYVLGYNQQYRHYRVTASAGGPATLTELPIPAGAVLSPDGQWFAHLFGLGSVATGETVATVEGYFVGWSPDSRAAFVTVSPPALTVISPALPTQPAVYPAAYPSAIAWSSLGPMLVQRPVDWNGGYSGCSSCYGLALENLADGSMRQVLDASAGMIDLVSAPPMLDTILVWARTCPGLYITVCSHSLLRVRLTDGAVQTVAVSPDKYPVGLSPDGQRVAIAAPSGIYIKTLAP